MILRLIHVNVEIVHIGCNAISRRRCCIIIIVIVIGIGIIVIVTITIGSSSSSSSSIFVCQR